MQPRSSRYTLTSSPGELEPKLKNLAQFQYSMDASGEYIYIVYGKMVKNR